ncbi:hypothetical protein AXF42_Ash017812 [Apostasia shenzhenica]|uniref:Uncharacterized protein n=1 Tax=Apostasia shenzhenica TaxID=1088818 RepID=A0A2I0A3U2_9ASPA|nr:hypothetical protein AXF42_Ash017812 [Apostasia shenzhenica]
MKLKRRWSRENSELGHQGEVLPRQRRFSPAARLQQNPHRHGPLRLRQGLPAQPKPESSPAQPAVEAPAALRDERGEEEGLRLPGEHLRAPPLTGPSATSPESRSTSAGSTARRSGVVTAAPRSTPPTPTIRLTLGDYVLILLVVSCC